MAKKGKVIKVTEFNTIVEGKETSKPLKLYKASTKLCLFEDEPEYTMMILAHCSEGAEILARGWLLTEWPNYTIGYIRVSLVTAIHMEE